MATIRGHRFFIALLLSVLIVTTLSTLTGTPAIALTNHYRQHELGGGGEGEPNDWSSPRIDPDYGPLTTSDVGSRWGYVLRFTTSFILNWW